MHSVLGIQKGGETCLNGVHAAQEVATMLNLYPLMISQYCGRRQGEIEIGKYLSGIYYNQQKLFHLIFQIQEFTINLNF